MSEIIQSHGNYQELESYQNSVVIFDATSDFCTNFLKKGDRTVDQMIQAARSGKSTERRETMRDAIKIRLIRPIRLIKNIAREVQ